MPIPFQCLQCDAKGTAGDRYAGQLVSCPRCKAMNRVPASLEEATAPPPPRPPQPLPAAPPAVEAPIIFEPAPAAPPDPRPSTSTPPQPQPTPPPITNLPAPPAGLDAIEFDVLVRFFIRALLALGVAIACLGLACLLIVTVVASLMR